MSNPPQDPNKPEDQPRYGQNPPPPAPQQQPGQQPTPEQHRPWQAPGQAPRPQYGESGPGPQYGPPPGQPQQGAQPPQSPYSYQAAQPGAYGYPGGHPPYQGEQGTITPPKEILISFWLLIAAAVLTAIDTVIDLSTIGSAATMQQLEMALGQQETEVPMDTEALIGFIAVATVVIVLIVIAVYLLIAFMVKKGKNWARITATVLAALSLLALIGPPSMLWLIAALGVAAVVLMYVPASSNFFQAHKARKQGAFGR